MNDELSKGELNDFTIGYNQGYRFAEALPSVSNKMFDNISEAVKQKPRMQGILKGISQKHKERFIEKQKEKAPKPLTSPSKDKSPPSPSIDR